MICYCQKCKHNSELSCTINTQINFEGKCAYCEERETTYVNTSRPPLNVCVHHWIGCEYATYNGQCSITGCKKLFG